MAGHRERRAFCFGCYHYSGPVSSASSLRFFGQPASYLSFIPIGRSLHSRCQTDGAWPHPPALSIPFGCPFDVAHGSPWPPTGHCRDHCVESVGRLYGRWFSGVGGLCSCGGPYRCSQPLASGQFERLLEGWDLRYSGQCGRDPGLSPAGSEIRSFGDGTVGAGQC